MSLELDKYKTDDSYMRNKEIYNIQKIELEIFKNFKMICDKYHFKYYAIGGTCIGAIRHGGFIPWDDDIDVVMPINDYLKFKKYAGRYLNRNYRVIDGDNTKGNTKIFLKITDMRTTFIEVEDINNESNYHGVFIDIMPIAGCPKNNKSKIKMYKKLESIRRFHFYRNEKFRNLRTIKTKVLWTLFHPFLKLFCYNYFITRWYGVLQEYKICDRNDIMFPWRRYERAVFSYEDFSSSYEAKFEDTSMSVPIGYDNYLKKDFGNYMELPPKNKRRTLHNIAVLDINQSYIKYKR